MLENIHAPILWNNFEIILGKFPRAENKIIPDGRRRELK